MIVEMIFVSEKATKKNMRTLAFFVLAAAFLVICNNQAEATNDAGGVIHVAGKVLCQDCSKGWKVWLYGGRPLQGSVVSLICKDDHGKVLLYKSHTTDKMGLYNMIVNKKVNGKDIKLDKCIVKLVSSSDDSCTIPTNFGGGLKGVKVPKPLFDSPNLCKIKVEPFYWTTPMCDEPETSIPQSSSPGSGY